MPRWSRVLGETSAIADLDFDPTDLNTRRFPQSMGERRVALAIRSAGRRLPYGPRCLDEATAAQLMLRRRHHPGVVVIGLAARGEPGQKRRAHAWLIGSTGTVTGGPAAQGFVAASCFVPRSIAHAT